MELIDIVNGKTSLYGIIGNPIEHSFSPQLQNTLIHITERDSIYVPMKVEPGDLESALKGMKAQGFKGFNVTMPHKQEIIKFMNWLTVNAENAGAVNTVKIEDGELIGHSTDGAGFLKDFKRLFKTDFKCAKVLCLGAGGAAVSVCREIIKESPKELVFAIRNKDKAEISLADFDNKAHSCIALTEFDTEEFPHYVENTDVIINATNIGMIPHEKESLILEEYLKKEHIVYDLVYNPGETMLVHDARSKGAAAETGLGMLVGQGIISFEFWNNCEIKDEVYEHLIKSLRSLITCQKT